MTGPEPPPSMSSPPPRAARWSIGFGLGFVLLLVLNALADADIRVGELNVLPATAFVLGAAALVSGIAAWRAGERSVILWAGLALGALAVILFVAELAFIE